MPSNFTHPPTDALAQPPDMGGLDDSLLTWDGPAKLDSSQPAADSPPLAVSVPSRTCPQCQAPRPSAGEYCGECGWIFPENTSGPDPQAESSPKQPVRVNDRFELGARISQRGAIERFLASGILSNRDEPLPVVLVRGPAPVLEEAIPVAEVETENAVGEQALADFDEAATASLTGTEVMYPESVWPSLAWEQARLDRATHPALPRVLERFVEGDYQYLVEELPQGKPLWDAWDDPDATAEKRFAWLVQLAEALDELHKAGAILEALRPEIIVVTPSGQARLTDLSDLLPMPVPPDVPIRAGLYSAPELIACPEQTDSRADLYTFGALVYALHMGRELSEADFERPGFPKAFIPLFPDAHPILARLISKTFCRDLDQRFPTEDFARDDATGFSQLLSTLDICRRTLDRVRLEIAAWTTTGMVRSGNEDAFALLHRVEGREDDLGESALILLADGMGGYEAGEIAAALAIQGLRRMLLETPPFMAVAGNGPFWPEGPREEKPLDVEKCQELLSTALQEANKLVHDAARSGIGRRGMGCTAEVVFIADRHVVVGHVGDSRTYHLQQGKLVQITRDHTLVNRLVELGHISAEEALKHPRRSELQQAIGGYNTVEPSVYASTLKPGDWIVVCSDGLSNHVYGEALREMLQTATSAEMAARRLINLTNLEGATDNATVVVARIT